MKDVFWNAHIDHCRNLSLYIIYAGECTAKTNAISVKERYAKRKSLHK